MKCHNHLPPLVSKCSDACALGTHKKGCIVLRKKSPVIIEVLKPNLQPFNITTLAPDLLTNWSSDGLVPVSVLGSDWRPLVEPNDDNVPAYARKNLKC